MDNIVKNPVLWSETHDLLKPGVVIYDLLYFTRNGVLFLRNGVDGEMLIYSWGSNGVVLGPSSTTYMPELKYNSTSPIFTTNKGSKLNPTIYMHEKSTNELWGFGSSSFNRLFGNPYKFFPIFLMDGVINFGLNHVAAMIENSTGLYIIGSNLKNTIGDENANLEYEELLPFNISLFEPYITQGLKPKTIVLENDGQFVILDDDFTTFGWGYISDIVSFKNEGGPRQIFPKRLQFLETPLCEVEAGSKIIQITCDDTGINCALLVENNAGRNEVHTWGVAQYFGRTPSDLTVPKNIDYSNIPPNVDIVMLSHRYYNVLLLGSNGDLFAYGRNSAYSLGTELNLDEILSQPSRIFNNLTNITGIPIAHGHSSNIFSFLIKSSFSCFNKYPSSMDVCSSHGTCFEEDKCICDDKFKGEECSIPKQCYNIDSTHPNVCNGGGDCFADNVCSCWDNFRGDQCEVSKCYQYWSDEIEVCNEKGDCIWKDKCLCEKFYFGRNCEEKVHNARFVTRDFDVIKINYEVKRELIHEYNEILLQNPFDCDDIIYDAVQIGNYITCYFVFDDENLITTHLFIDNIKADENRIRVNQNITLFPITPFDEKYIFLKLKNYERTLNDFLIDFWYVVVFSILFPIVLLIVIALVILVLILFFVFPILRKQRKEISKMDGIKEIDVVLAEVRAEQHDLSKGKAKFSMKSSDFVIDAKELKLIKIIGQGGSSTLVFLAEWKDKKVAYKKYSLNYIDSTSDFEEFEKELQFVSKLSFPYILKFWGCTISFPMLGIVSEYCENGDLCAFLQGNSNVSYGNKLRLLYEIALALEFLHSKSFIHRDMKCENVLISKSKEVRVMDFGLSKIVKNADITKTRRIGTPQYMSPDIINSDKYGKEIDIYSFAIITFCVISNNFFPYGMNVQYEIECRVAKDPNFRPKIDPSVFKDEWLIDMMKRGWEHDPNKRIGITEILKILKEKVEKYKDQDLSIQKNSEDMSNDKNNIEIKKLKNVIKQIESEKKSLKDENDLLKDPNYQPCVHHREARASHGWNFWGKVPGSSFFKIVVLVVLLTEKTF